MKNQYILKSLQDVGLAHHFETFKPLVRAAVSLDLTRSEEENLPIGQSKIGGRPDLPKLWGFPHEQLSNDISRPYSFLGQINFSEIVDFDKDGFLPSIGIIYFFFSEDLYGDLDRGSFFKILYYDGDLKFLERKEFPENSDKDWIYPACSVNFSQEYDYPNEFPDFLGDEEFDNFFELRRNFKIKLLGYSDPIQNPAEGSYFPLDGKVILPENPEHRNWRTLIQFPTNEHGMHWIDDSTIYFGIREDKLEKNDFTKCCYCLQMF